MFMPDFLTIVVSIAISVAIVGYLSEDVAGNWARKESLAEGGALFGAECN